MAARTIEAGGALRLHVVRARMVDAERDGAGNVGTGESLGLAAHGLGGTELQVQNYPESADEQQGCDQIPGAVRSAVASDLRPRSGGAGSPCRTACLPS